ncbi:YfcZ/YiiS family protein [Caviibacterium pharyngocola]|uniref:DUF406 domain-containing protein n=1 Tax=Caviibacterium pharyngocola TaxID=28159 RepID=A0A2M8RTX9_9PAST|nr:YfcZ/YiiS family protein [Caviibacterium pharyngocola]PJG82351.1 hypothetical protein CVP04_09570 [Caviibacterium pharyngocola]
MKQDQPIECVGCNTFDVGTIIDNSDCTSHIEKYYPTQAEAEAALAVYTQKARNAETDPCEIRSDIQAVENGFRLTADFTFSCQAESLIFELATR